MKPFGKLTHGAGQWTIECTPDLAMRLKRIFPRMVQSKSSQLVLKHTPEVAADIEWILLRFPLEVSVDHGRVLTAAADGYRETIRKAEEAMRRPVLEGANHMTMPPRDYQKVAAALYLAQNHLLLADVVGLGKTVSAITTFTDARTLPAIVVVKPHLAKQWAAEIHSFMPLLRSHIIKQGTHYDLPEAEIYIVSYTKLAKWWGVLAERCRSVVFDEIQELRIPDSEKYRAAAKLTREVSFRLGMSATPIFNYGGETWAVMNLIAPDVLGTHDEFIREWCSTEYGERRAVVSNPEALGSYLRNQKLMLRRTRREVGRELPPVIRYVQDADIDRDAYEKGTAAADELARTILSGSFIERGQAARELDLQLRQATGLAKAPFVADLVRMLVESGEKVLLAGWHRAVYEVWRSRLHDLRIVMFTGEESPAAKEQARKTFIEGNADVMMMSLRSGDGTNGLQSVCSVVVLGELDWSPKVHEQFIGRLARDGQEESVQVFIPVCDVGSDPTMAEVLSLKEAQSAGIIELGEVNGQEMVETDPHRMRKLAEDYLKARKQPIPL